MLAHSCAKGWPAHLVRLTIDLVVRILPEGILTAYNGKHEDNWFVTASGTSTASSLKSTIGL